MSIDWGASSLVMAGPGTCLVEASPVRPVQPMGDDANGVGDQFGEEVSNFVYSQGNQRIVGRISPESFARGDDGEDGVGEHDEGGVAVPGGPFPDLVLVEADLALAGLEAFLDAPPGAGDPDQGTEVDGLG